jgi:hypothetical protein
LASLHQGYGFGFNFRTASFNKHGFAISRRMRPKICWKLPALYSEGAGNAGRPMRPQPRV